MATHAAANTSGWTDGAVDGGGLYGETPRAGVLGNELPRRLTNVPRPNLHRTPRGSTPSSLFRSGSLDHTA